ncbi:MAG: MmcQ/YjbR family DNA-binding protein [Actinomycetota bacterium]
MGTAPEAFQHAVSDRIRRHALTFPEVEEGTSCVNRAFKAGGKNFVFLGEKDAECNIRLKLGESVPEVEALAAASEPGRFDVGKGGWAMIRFPPDQPPDDADLERWVTESFLLLAPKRVSAQYRA